MVDVQEARSNFVKKLVSLGDIDSYRTRVWRESFMVLFYIVFTSLYGNDGDYLPH